MFNMRLSNNNNNNEPISNFIFNNFNNYNNKKLDVTLTTKSQSTSTLFPSPNQDSRVALKAYKKIGILGHKILPLCERLNETQKEDLYLNAKSDEFIIKKLISTNLDEISMKRKYAQSLSSSIGKSEFKQASNSRLLVLDEEESGNDDLEAKETLSKSSSNSFKFDFDYYTTRQTTLRELHERIKNRNAMTDKNTTGNYLNPNTKIIFHLSKIHSNNRKINSSLNNSFLSSSIPNRKSADIDSNDVKTLTLVDFKEEHK